MTTNLLYNSNFNSPLITTNTYKLYADFTEADITALYWSSVNYDGIAILNGTNDYNYASPSLINCTQAISLQNTSDISQTVTIVDLVTYQLNFNYVGRPNPNNFFVFNPLDVFINGVLVYTVSTYTTTWSEVTIDYTPTNFGSCVIQFKTYDNGQGQDQNICLTNVKFYQKLTTVGPIFQPVSDGCYLWLDSSELSTITLNNGRVSAWMDKTGNFTLTNSTNNGPYLNSNNLNGKSVLQFLNNEYLSVANDLNLNTKSFAIFVLSKANDLTTDMTIISKGDNNNIGSFNIKRTGSTINSLTVVPNNTTAISFPETYIGNKYRIISYLFNRNYGYQYLCENGQVQTYSVFPPDKEDISYNVPLIIGASTNSQGLLQNYLKGNIAEILIFKTENDMDDITRNKIEYYLASKWDLVNESWDQMPVIYNANGYVGTYIQGFAPNSNVILGYYSNADGSLIPLYGSSNRLLGYADISGYINMRNYGLYATGDTVINGNITSTGLIYNLSNNVVVGLNYAQLNYDNTFVRHNSNIKTINNTQNTEIGFSSLANISSLNFAPANSYCDLNLSIPNNNYCSLTSGTIEAWINTRELNVSSIVRKGNEVSSNYWLAIRNGQFGVYASQDSGSYPQTPEGSGFFSSNKTINNGIWRHVAISFNYNSVILYVDGTKEISYMGVYIIVDSVSLTIGCSFNGSISRVRIWNTVRTDKDIQTNYNKDISNSPDLIAYYPFTEARGSILKNSVVEGIDMRINNALWNASTSTAIGRNAIITASNQIVLGTSSEKIYIPSKYVNVVKDITTYGNNILTNYASFNTDKNSSNSNSITVRGNVSFFSKNVEKMRLTYNGNVGINTTTPLYGLHVYGTSRFSSAPIISGQNIGSDLNIGVGKQLPVNKSGNHVLGYNGYINNIGNYNTVMGFGSLIQSKSTSFTNNSFFGSKSGYSENTSIYTNNSFFGYYSGYRVIGLNNSLFGCYSGKDHKTSFKYNTSFGAYSSAGGTENDTFNFYENCSFGAFSLGNTITTNPTTSTNPTYYINHCAFGSYALYSSNTFSNSINNGSITNACSNAFGYNSLYKASIESYYNNSFGANSLYNCTTGCNNCSFGYNSSNNLVNGSNNVSFGSYSLLSSDCSYNTAIGSYSCNVVNSTANNNNTSIGCFSLYNNTYGNNNTAIGYNSLYSNTTGNNNTAIGSFSLYTNTTGSNNLAIGYYAGINNNNNSNNVFIGNNTKIDLSSNNWSNSVALGNNATIYQNNQITLGGPGGNVYVPGYMYVGNVKTSARINERSDYRVKSNIKILNDSISTDFFTPVKYFNKKTLKSECGFIADDVEKIYPFLVGSTDIEEKYKFLDYTSIIGVTTKDIIEMKKTNKIIDCMFDEFDSYLM